MTTRGRCPGSLSRSPHHPAVLGLAPRPEFARGRRLLRADSGADRVVGCSDGRAHPDPGGIGPIGKWTASRSARRRHHQCRRAPSDPAGGWVIAWPPPCRSLADQHAAATRTRSALFQQRPSRVGHSRAVARPSYAATRFYQKMQTIDGWRRCR